MQEFIFDDPRFLRMITADGSTHADIDESTNGHGTCVTSIAVGISVGVKKKSKLVVVKSGRDAAAILDSWLKVAENIVLNDVKRHAVMVRSLSSIKIFAKGDEPPDPRPKIHDYIRKINDLEVPVVVSAGNNGDRSHKTDTFPALWSEETPGVYAVSALNLDGSRRPSSQYGHRYSTETWAPGQNVRCAANAAGPSLATKSGTSMAAPMVGSGIAPLAQCQFDIASCKDGAHNASQISS